MRKEPGIAATFGASAVMSSLIVWVALIFVTLDPNQGICFGGDEDAPTCPASPCHAVCGTTKLKPKKLSAA